MEFGAQNANEADFLPVLRFTPPILISQNVQLLWLIYGLSAKELIFTALQEQKNDGNV